MLQRLHLIAPYHSGSYESLIAMEAEASTAGPDLIQDQLVTGMPLDVTVTLNLSRLGRLSCELILKLWVFRSLGTRLMPGGADESDES